MYYNKLFSTRESLYTLKRSLLFWCVALFFIAIISYQLKFDMNVQFIELLDDGSIIFLEKIHIQKWPLLQFLLRLTIYSALLFVLFIFLRRRKWQKRILTIFGFGVFIITGHFVIWHIHILPNLPISSPPDKVSASQETWLSKEILNISPNNISSKREALIDLIWKGKALSDLHVDEIAKVKTADNKLFKPYLDNVTQITLLKKELSYGFFAVGYRLVPYNSNGIGVIYHQGHNLHGALNAGTRVINRLLKGGYTVIALSMPGTGQMIEPQTITYQRGKIQLSRKNGAVYFHDQIGKLDHEFFSALSLFLSASAMATNHLKSYLGDDAPIAMIGLSGGGWTATIYPAIDPRIELSIPVAGTLPLFSDKLGKEDFVPTSESYRDFLGQNLGRDYEQQHPELLKIANYPEQYVMASVGVGRRHIQILNAYDPCCFNGLQAKLYEKSVVNKVKEFNEGDYQLMITSDRWHRIGPKALDKIMTELERFK